MQHRPIHFLTSRINSLPLKKIEFFLKQCFLKYKLVEWNEINPNQSVRSTLEKVLIFTNFTLLNMLENIWQLVPTQEIKRFIAPFLQLGILMNVPPLATLFILIIIGIMIFAFIGMIIFPFQVFYFFLFLARLHARFSFEFED